MWNFIYYRGYMSHAHVELYLLQGLYVPCPCGNLFITGAICPTVQIFCKIRRLNLENCKRS
jgi:hypothetical protein